MSSLVPGQFLEGKRWDYHIVEPVRGDGTHTSVIWKAEPVRRKENATDIPKWFVMLYQPSPNSKANSATQGYCQKSAA